MFTDAGRPVRPNTAIRCDVHPPDAPHQPPPPTVSETGARPLTPITRAAAGLKSITRPRTNGPRSVIRTTTARPFRLLTTVTLVPNGRVRWAAVMAPALMRAPLAVVPPL